jgi:hypothetical protein
MRFANDLITRKKSDALKSFHVTLPLSPLPREGDVLRHCRDGKYYNRITLKT